MFGVKYATLVHTQQMTVLIKVKTIIFEVIKVKYSKHYPWKIILMRSFINFLKR
jgi:hypothetical protein